MKSLVTTLLSLVLAAFAAFGVLRFLGNERPEATPGVETPSPAPAADAHVVDPAGGSPGGTRTVLDDPGQARAGASSGDVDEDGGKKTPPADPEVDSTEAARLAQVEERYRREARAVAEALDLTLDDEGRLYAILLGEYQRRAAYFDELRKKATDPEARDRVREELVAIQTWKTQELQAQLGAELAQAVRDFETASDRGLFRREFERDSKERSED